MARFVRTRNFDHQGFTIREQEVHARDPRVISRNPRIR